MDSTPVVTVTVGFVVRLKLLRIGVALLMAEFRWGSRSSVSDSVVRFLWSHFLSPPAFILTAHYNLSIRLS